MKAILFPVIAIAGLCLSSCKSVQPVSNYQQQSQPQPQQPSRVMRAAEPCIELATAESENLRAYGTAISYIEKTALNEAERDARNNLAEMIKVAVEGAAVDYEQNAQQNMKGSADTIGEAVMSQFVAEEVKNTRVIKTTIYDRSDGSVQVYVCIEMKTSEEDFGKELSNTLSRENIIGIQYDRDRFIDQVSKGLDEYKEREKQQQ